jgi:hypothetical protein
MTRRLMVLAASAAVLIVAVLAVASIGRSWPSAQGTPYVFSPCPGLTVTSSVTTGIWNCPNIPAPRGVNGTFTVGQEVTINGTWATGYGTFGCVPQSGQSSCVVPQLASLQDYLYANIGGGMWFVVQWKGGSTVQLVDGQNVTISGSLQEITYPSSPGSTFPIYHLNNQTNGSNLLHPQPIYEITNAVLA